MLCVMSVSSTDVLMDVGCGDGRLLLEAARQRRIAEGVGVEVNPVLAALAQRNVDAFTAAHPHLPSRLSIVQCDARRLPSLGSASVLSLYLSQRGNRQLRPLLAGICSTSRAVELSPSASTFTPGGRYDRPKSAASPSTSSMPPPSSRGDENGYAHEECKVMHSPVLSPQCGYIDRYTRRLDTTATSDAYDEAAAQGEENMTEPGGPTKRRRRWLIG